MHGIQSRWIRWAQRVKSVFVWIDKVTDDYWDTAIGVKPFFVDETRYDRLPALRPHEVTVDSPANGDCRASTGLVQRGDGNGITLPCTFSGPAHVAVSDGLIYRVRYALQSPPLGEIQALLADTAVEQ